MVIDWNGASTLASSSCLFLSGKCFLMLNNVVKFLASTDFLIMKHCYMLKNGPGLPLPPLPSGLGVFWAGQTLGKGQWPAWNGPFLSDPTTVCPSRSHGQDCLIPGHHLLCISQFSEPSHAQLGDVFHLKCVHFSRSAYPMCVSFLFVQIFDTYTSNGKGWTWLKHTVQPQASFFHSVCPHPCCQQTWGVVRMFRVCCAKHWVIL